MKIVTHVRPHLDEIMAVWLIDNYWPEGKGAKIEFIDNNERPEDVDQDPEVLYVGVGRGRFDEHRGVEGECAAGLVWAELRERNATLGDEEKKAIDKLVSWVREEDLGLNMKEPHREFSVPAVIEGWYLHHNKNSVAAVGLGVRILDALMLTQRNSVRLERDWDKRVEFDSRFGKAVALQTDAERPAEYAYGQGFELAVIMNSSRTYRTIRASAQSDIDLTDVAEEIRRRESKAEWFLHHSKRMLILGGDHDAGAQPSQLDLPDMIDILK